MTSSRDRTGDGGLVGGECAKGFDGAEMREWYSRWW
jgi:hypothetical protein